MIVVALPMCQLQAMRQVAGYFHERLHNFLDRTDCVVFFQVKLSEERKGPWGFHSNREFVRLDISFESPSHTGLRTAELVFLSFDIISVCFKFCLGGT
jgi:hypothetical protein